ncbi:unnamed protein product, partial [marine sediment metagenome]
MIEKGHNNDIKTEWRNKGAETRRTVGILVSALGGMLYLIYGLSQIKQSLGYTYSFYTISRISGITALLAGVISLVGTIVGTRNVKTGGILNLVSIPTALVIGFVLLSISGVMYSIYNFIPFIMMIVYPLPLPHSFHVISGGILCLTGSD